MKEETRHTVEILSPNFHNVKDWIEGYEGEIGILPSEIYLIGWSDSDNEDNDEGVYKIAELLFKKAEPKPNSMHPETREPSSIVTYKGFKVLTSAGPNIFASEEAIKLLAKDAGVDTKPYKVRE